MSESNNNGYKLSSAAGDMNVLGRSSSSLNCLALDYSSRPTWEELEEVEFQRREIIQRVEQPFWRILAYWNGTALKALASESMIWIPILIFLAIRIQARVQNTMPAVAERLGDTDIDILGGFLSFLLVLFVNQTNNRFFEMYLLAKKCAGKVQDVAGLAGTELPPDAARRLVRYMNAAHVAGYVGLGGPYSKRYFFDHFNQSGDLLNKDEARRVFNLDKMDSGSACFKELVTWCQKEVGLAKKAGQVDSYEAQEMHCRILELRGAMDGIYDFCDQPTHFFYIHFLCLLSALYLPLFAVDNGYSAGWGDDSDWGIELLSGLIVFLQSIFVVGLRLLGQKMLDPFGDDLEDLSVITYVSTTLENSQIILTTCSTKSNNKSEGSASEAKRSNQNKAAGVAA